MGYVRRAACKRRIHTEPRPPEGISTGLFDEDLGKRNGHPDIAIGVGDIYPSGGIKESFLNLSRDQCARGNDSATPSFVDIRHLEPFIIDECF